MEKSYQYKTQILERHLDTFGHVNNAMYLTLLEEARWDLLENMGYGLATILQKQQGPVVLELDLRFKHELCNREWITIVSTPAPRTGKIMKMHQTIINSSGALCTEANFTFGFMDLKERKLILPPSEWTW